MPPKGKKKKVISNRGFSTTSVPGKKVEEQVIEVTLPEEDTTPLPTLSSTHHANGNVAVNGAAVTAEEWTPETAEKHALQALMETVRPTADKEIARMSKVLDYERRLAKSFPTYLWAESDLQRRILALAASGQNDTLLPSTDHEDKIVTKIATIFGILVQLGFTKQRAEECLRKIRNLDLEDALDWLFLRCNESELQCEGPIPAPLPFSTPIIRSEIPIAKPLAAVPVLPTNGVPLPRVVKTAEPAPIDDSHRARILAYDEDTADLESVGNSVADEEAESANKWVNLKLQVSELQRTQAAAKRSAARGKIVAGEKESIEAKIISLGKKMKTAEGDYQFRRVDAEKLFKAARVNLDAVQLSARLSSVEVEAPSPFARAPRVKTSTNGSSTTTNGSNGESGTTTTLEEDKTTSDSEEGGLFGNMLEEMPTEAVNDAGTTIAVRDMGLLRSFSGKSPRVNLEETVRKIDKFATVGFTPISRSRACRASVTIRWDGGRTQIFEMQDVACQDVAQSNNYIATVALFSVGQATGCHKVLPLVFKDLWDELVAQRKTEEDETYRNELKTFKSIAELRIQPSAAKVARIAKAHSDEEGRPINSNGISAEESARITHDFALREQWESYQHILQQRANLPIAAFREHIMSVIDSSQCVVLCGETGCGKSTQVPSFILEHGMRRGQRVKIWCTEPRRISAVSLAQRVSSELGEASGACGTRSSLVGYSIRLDSRVSASSRIIFATTGIVLRMLEGESLLDASHLIIDEVHERSIDSDFLLLLLRSLLQKRKDLKVILMSATVDADKMSAYMGNCPVIQVPGRTFPVTPYFLEEVVELTQYRLESTTDSPFVARNMRNHGKGNLRPSTDDIPDDDDDEEDGLQGSNAINISKQSRMTIEVMDHHAINYDLIVMLLENLCFFQTELIPFSAAILIFLPSLETIRKLSDILEGHEGFGTSDFLILPLHSTISNENQSLVFDIPAPGVRKIVISTNLAETGVTIPDITAVIDTGKSREMRYDEKRQISRLVEAFVAQSNASQRRGRAGRVQEGICFHLFTRQRHEQMPLHPQPEITRLSLQDLALRIKTMKIEGSIEEVLAQALDPPSTLNVQRAIASLIEAKALTTTEDITALGRHLAKLPMDVHLGKFLIQSCLFGCLDAALTIISALNSKSPWVTPFGREVEADAVKRSFKIENSDFLTVFNAYGSWREASSNGYERDFCRKSFLSQQNFQMIEELRQQYLSLLVDLGFVQVGDRRALQPLRYGKSKTRFVQVPIEYDHASHDAKAVMACLATAMYPKLLVIDPQNGSMRTLANSATASIHPSSVNFTPGRRVDFGGARYAAFFTAMATKKLYVWESGSVDERAVYLLCGNADFQLPAHSLSIDRKIRVHLEPKTAVSMKLLRKHFGMICAASYRDPFTKLSSSDLRWLKLIKESLFTKKVEHPRTSEAEKIQVKISLVKYNTH